MARQQECLPYRISLRTSHPPHAVLSDLAAREVAGVGVSERGPHYVLLQDRRRRLYGPDLAVGLGIVILLAVLIGYGYHPLAIAFLPAALLPALPLLGRREGTMMAVGAVSEPDGATRVTAHGQVSPQLAAALDAYVASLPAPWPASQAASPHVAAGMRR